jgi:hypothetical protein
VIYKWFQDPGQARGLAPPESLAGAVGTFVNLRILESCEIRFNDSGLEVVSKPIKRTN